MSIEYIKGWNVSHSHPFNLFRWLNTLSLLLGYKEKQRILEVQ